MVSEDSVSSIPSTAKECVPPPEKAVTVKATEPNAELIAQLDEKARRIYEMIPTDRAISLDKMMVLGYKINDLVSTATFLEIKGLINSLPGNLYIRKS